MANLTSATIDLVEELNWATDLRQDFYVAWMEAPDNERVFANVQHLRSFCHGFYANLLRNQKAVARRRMEIEQESVDYITSALGLIDEGCDPMDQMIAEEEIGNKLKELSPLLRVTLERVVIDGASHEDVAVEEGTSVNVIYQRLHKAKEILRGNSNE